MGDTKLISARFLKVQNPLRRSSLPWEMLPLDDNINPQDTAVGFWGTGNLKYAPKFTNEEGSPAYDTTDFFASGGFSVQLGNEHIITGALAGGTYNDGYADMRTSLDPSDRDLFLQMPSLLTINYRYMPPSWRKDITDTDADGRILRTGKSFDSFGFFLACAYNGPFGLYQTPFAQYSNIDKFSIGGYFTTEQKLGEYSPNDVVESQLAIFGAITSVSSEPVFGNEFMYDKLTKIYQNEAEGFHKPLEGMTAAYYLDVHGQGDWKRNNDTRLTASVGGRVLLVDGYEQVNAPVYFTASGRVEQRLPLDVSNALTFEAFGTSSFFSGPDSGIGVGNEFRGAVSLGFWADFSKNFMLNAALTYATVTPWGDSTVHEVSETHLVTTEDGKHGTMTQTYDLTPHRFGGSGLDFTMMFTFWRGEREGKLENRHAKMDVAQYAFELGALFGYQYLPDTRPNNNASGYFLGAFIQGSAANIIE